MLAAIGEAAHVTADHHAQHVGVADLRGVRRAGRDQLGVRRYVFARPPLGPSSGGRANT
ncbi:hypothetical protein MAHJHV57_54550 [Mycobacterium avium subsp. hominissuis]